jgi:predicted oxidoreductase (fatty acid repression mutant protein)
MGSVSKETPFLQAVVARRTNYTLTPESSIPDARIQEILTTTLENAPSTFGSYTTRLVLLLKDEHFKFWDLVTDVVKSVTPPEQFDAHTKPRLAGFRNAYGTVLYFEDPENTRKLQDQFAFAKDHFPVWAHHTSAIHQFIIWTAFTNEGLGANLQHYNPLIDEKVKAQWGIPATWDLIAQMPFGVASAPPQPKPTHMKKPIEERLFVHGA